MSWLKYVFQAIAYAPAVVALIEHIHGSSVSGAAKKQMASDALLGAAAVAGAVLPSHQAEVTAATSVAGAAIDAAVQIANLFGQFKHGAAPGVTPAPTPTLVAAPQTATATAPPKQTEAPPIEVASPAAAAAAAPAEHAHPASEQSGLAPS